MKQKTTKKLAAKIQPVGDGYVMTASERAELCWEVNRKVREYWNGTPVSKYGNCPYCAAPFTAEQINAEVRPFNYDYCCEKCASMTREQLFKNPGELLYAPCNLKLDPNAEPLNAARAAEIAQILRDDDTNRRYVLLQAGFKFTWNGKPVNGAPTEYQILAGHRAKYSR